jgi:hypothetical protein
LEQRQPGGQEEKEKNFVRQPPPGFDQIGLKLIENTYRCRLIHAYVVMQNLDTFEALLAQTNQPWARPS